MDQLRPIPKHIGIIMDGNGRWAERRGKPRSFGHKSGTDTAKKVITSAIEMGIEWLTLYVFSTENWKRPEREVRFLMELIRRYMKSEAPFYHKNKIRLHHLGDPERLPEEIRREIVEASEATSHYDRLHLALAINYGGRDEILRSFQRWVTATLEKGETISSAPTSEEFSTYLDLPEAPSPDLIIRTAGEQRMSNFLLWESAYSEYYFSEVLWPDFDGEELSKAIEFYRGRKRKYGGVG
ncbi:polyprenyl diphosphate synthase [Sediminispirochaeta smaragdinae]|uniref:Isoprenyl transferase n=1 Tax=Sediminispirochaeta smaragdinae (strain DSM 11293 / JCM 15392 / SEBR 4228) TaxID=573413 RepID=E1R285_SEDSS|nr:polyprenyl diphosphate synthase [Sediminispirochaeta smaragdinae]ADK81970.1 undecaprenyl diphosphate synthase [Sediminispirochaeta smaragdinae DSM 11293]